MSPHYHLLHHVHIMNYTPSPNVVTSSPSVVTPSVSVVSLFHADQNQESDTGYATNDNNNVSWVDGPVGSQDLDTGVMVLHKLLAGLTIFLVTFVGGVGPALVQKLCRGTHQRRRLQGLKGPSGAHSSSGVLLGFQSFSSGCLLALIFLHLMPEIVQDFHSSLPHKIWIKQNLGLFKDSQLNALAGFVVLTGFLLILWLDYLISLLQFSRNLSQLPKSWTRRDLAASEGNGSKSRVTTEEDSAPCSWEEERQKEQLTRILEVEEHGDESSDDDEIYVHEHLEDEVLMGWARIKEEQRLRYDRSKETLCSQILSVTPALAALSAHSLLEGVTVASQESLVSLWVVLLAIAGHKWIIAMSLGVTLAQKKLRNTAFIFLILTFSAMTPLGISFGSLIIPIDHGNLNKSPVGEHGASVKLEQPSLDWGLIVQALSLGSLIYITLFELLIPATISLNQRRQKRSCQKLGSLLALTLGLLLVTALQLF